MDGDRDLDKELRQVIDFLADDGAEDVSQARIEAMLGLDPEDAAEILYELSRLGVVAVKLDSDSLAPHFIYSLAQERLRTLAHSVDPDIFRVEPQPRSRPSELAERRTF